MEKGSIFMREFDLSSDVYSLFLEAFKDKNPLHTDDSFAQSKGFEMRVMHGNILNGFISYFIGECLPTKNVIIQKQEIQFHLPVYVNSKLKFEAKIEEFYESVNSYEFKFYFENENRKKVAKGKIQIGILK
jgi:3-hydroxybutyryl-CoA dehydratase